MSNWYDSSVFYHIYPLGFCGAEECNDFESAPKERLLKIIEWIPHFSSMGINAIYLGPLFESESHGYDTVDYYRVDRRLGTNETLKRVVKELHNSGIKVVLDGVFNHVSRHFFGFKDLQCNGESSLFKEWFKNVNFTNKSPLGDNFSYECWRGCYSLPNLNLRNSFVESHILNAVTMWVQEFEIDGLRLDVADVLDFDFMKELSSFCKTVKKEFWLMGEVIHGDYNNWINPSMLNSTTNYECYKGMYSSLNDSNMFEIAYSLNRLFNRDNGLYKNLKLYNFVDNHDVNRISSILKDRGYLFPLHIMLFTIPGIPSIYYGSEWGISGEKESNSDRVLRPCIDLHDMDSKYSHDLKDVIVRLVNMWKNSSALKYGTYREIQVKNEQFIFSREYNGEEVIIGINSGLGSESFKINVGNKKTAIDILNYNREIKVAGSELEIEVPGMWGVVLNLK